MLKSTRAALAIGLGLVGVAGLVGRSNGQDAAVRKASGNSNAAPAAPATFGPAVVGTLDLEHVLKNYDKVKYMWESSQGEALEKQKELMKLAAEAKAEDEKLQKLNNPLDQKRSQEKITSLEAQFQAGKKSAQMEFAQKDAANMAAVYTDIQRMSDYAAKQRGVNLVVRHSATPPSGSDPRSVEAAMFNAVIYADPKIDLTNDVLRYLNIVYKRNGGPMPKGDSTPAAVNAAPGAPGTAAQPRPGTQR